ASMAVGLVFFTSVTKLSCRGEHTGPDLKTGPDQTEQNASKESDAAIKALVARSVANALVEHETNRSKNGDDNHDSGTGSRRTKRATRERTYSDFLKCQPLNFKAIPWKTLMKMMTDKYCPRGEIKKLEIEMWNLKVKGTDVVGIEFATELMDQKIRDFADRQAENKRKLDDNSRNNQNQQQPFKKQNVARVLLLMLTLRGLSLALSGVQGHYKRDCLKLKNKNRGNQAGNGNAQARAYDVGIAR
nr:hypothetical protein [Tanacetum cinerariifolium]